MRTRATVGLLLSLLLAGCALGTRSVPFDTVAHGKTLDGFPRTTPQDRERLWGTGPLFATRLLVAHGVEQVGYLLDEMMGCSDCGGSLGNAGGTTLCVTCQKVDAETQVLVAALMQQGVVLTEKHPVAILAIRTHGSEVRLVAHVEEWIPERLYAQAVSYAYHVVAIPRERLPEDNVTFVLVDERGQELAREAVDLARERPGAD